MLAKEHSLSYFSSRDPYQSGFALSLWQCITDFDCERKLGYMQQIPQLNREGLATITLFTGLLNDQLTCGDLQRPKHFDASATGDRVKYKTPLRRCSIELKL